MQKRIIRPHDRPELRVRNPEDAHVREVSALGELMLGAAYADGDKGAVEIVAIAEQLKEFIDIDHVPNLLARRMAHFDPNTFAVEAACAQLRLENQDDRLAVLQLIAKVVGADNILHPAEIAYLRRVAVAIGIDPEQLQLDIRPSTRFC